MAQSKKLISQYDPNAVFSLIVGATAITKNLLYTRDTDGTLILAGANEDRILFAPLEAETAGMSVACGLVGAGTFNFIASGAINKDASVAPAASGKVAAAGAGDLSIGRALNTAADGEIVSIVTWAQKTVLGASGNTGTHGEGWVDGVFSEEVTLATGGATTDTVGNAFPANSDIIGCTWRVTEAINNAAAWIAGLKSGDLDGLVVTGSALTLNANGIGVGALVGTYNAAAAKASITTSGGTQNTTGKIRLTVFYRQYTAPTS